jgi:hypothetical protein
MFRSLIAFGLITLVSCSPKTSNDLHIKNSFIINGASVLANDPIATSVVAVYNAKTKYLCTGTLIAPHVVLTAAHCTPERVSQVKIIFSNDIDDVLNSRELDMIAELVLPATDFKVGPTWDPKNEAENNTGDIALFKFNGDLPSGYAPATFIADDSVLKRGDMMTMVGFGVDDVDMSKEIDPKKYHNIDEAIATGEVTCNGVDRQGQPIDCYKVKLTGDGILRQTQAPISTIFDTEIRLNESKSGTCSGDSGGPLFLKKDNAYFLVGVTSRGSALCNDVGVYTRALFYKSWISETLKAFN